MELTYSFVIIVFISLTKGHMSTQEVVSRLSRDWGPWTGWSSCSHTCGYGTAYRIRRCHADQSQGKEQSCQGPSKQFKICHISECALGSAQDYRSRECAKHNDVLYGHQRYTWEPYINSEAPCQLSCKSTGHGYYAKFKDTVDDGVVCNEDHTAICLDGQCVSAGCDGVLGSRTPVDRCGVCAGDGSTCRFIRGIFTRTHLPLRAYSEVTTIPAGARNINITEMGVSRNHLALSSLGAYFLNGRLRLQGPGQVHGAGTTFTYRRRNGGCRGECLQAPGPLNVSVKVELLPFGRNLGITYEFSVDLDSTALRRGNEPNHGHAGRAGQRLNGQSVTAQQGGQNSNEQKDQEPNRLRSEIIPRVRKGQIPVQVTEPALKKHHQELQHQHRHRHHSHQHKSPAESGNKQRGILAQGTKGNYSTFMYQHYYHTNDLDDLGDVPMVSHHGIAAGHEPAKETIWPESENSGFDDERYAEFSATTQYHHAPVTSGSSFPAVVAASILNQKKSHHSHADRQDNRVGSGQDVRLSYSWRISGLLPCTEPCGGGVQEPRVVCVKEGSQIEVIPENCDESKKPSTTSVPCNTQPCGASWHLNDWGPCSVTCGRGLQKRGIECRQRISPTLSLPVTSTSCPQPQPPTRQFCQLDPCFVWKTSNWTKCSVDCGFGQRKRDVHCTDASFKTVSDQLCPQVRPAGEEICNMGSCAQGWFHSQWSAECSAECGSGHHTREVFCLAPDGTKLDEAKCGKHDKPHEQKSCKSSKPCGGQWFTGPWSQCNTTCGPNSFRHRDIFCIKHHGSKVHHIVKDHNCLKDARPAQEEACGQLADCKPEWYLTAWSECSKTCGTGVKTREIKCLDGKHLQSADCDKTHKPSKRHPCNTQPCLSNHIKLPAEKQTTSIDAAVQMDWSAPAASAEHFSCSDSEDPRWCQVARRARLCQYQHYNKICCRTCHDHDSH